MTWGVTSAYGEIKAGRLKAVQVGDRMMIRDHDSDAYRASLPEVDRQNNRSWTTAGSTTPCPSECLKEKPRRVVRRGPIHKRV